MALDNKSENLNHVSEANPHISNQFEIADEVDVEFDFDPTKIQTKQVTLSNGEVIEFGLKMIDCDSTEKLWWDKELPTGNSTWNIWVNGVTTFGLRLQYDIKINKTSSGNATITSAYNAYYKVPGTASKDQFYWDSTGKKKSVYYQVNWTGKISTGTTSITSQLRSEITSKNKLSTSARGI